MATCKEDCEEYPDKFRYRSWFVEDVERLHAESLETFRIPTAKQRRGLRVGDLAKLIFELDSTDERPHLWVRIECVTGLGYSGVIENQAPEIPDLQVGQPILFGPENVADIRSHQIGIRAV